jgi:hypothetical protein
MNYNSTIGRKEGIRGLEARLRQERGGGEGRRSRSAGGQEVTLHRGQRGGEEVTQRAEGRGGGPGRGQRGGEEVTLREGGGGQRLREQHLPHTR